MASTEDLLIAIQADTKGATTALEALQKQFKELGQAMKASEGSLKKVEKSATSFGDKAVKLNQVMELATKGFMAVKNVVEASVGAYVESADGIKRLGNTLTLLGESNIPDTIASFRQFAGALQETTTAEDDQVIGLLNMAKMLGLSNEAAKKMVTTANNLAAATGKGLQEAFNDLQSANAGVAKGLGKLFPELKNLTEEQLKAGAATDILAVKLDGFARASAGTFTSQLAMAKNEIGDLMEELGEIIFKGFRFEESLASQRKFIKEFKETLESSKPFLIALGRNFVGVFQSSFDIVIGGVTAFAADFIKVGSMIAGALGAKKLSADMNAAFQDMHSASELMAAGLVENFTSAGKVSAELAAEMKKVGVAGVAAKKAIAMTPMVTESELKLLDEIKKKLGDLMAAQAQAGASEVGRIQAKLALNIQELNALQAKADKEIKNAAALQQANANLNAAKVAAAVAAQAEIDAIIQKEVDDIGKRNEDIENAISERTDYQIEQIERARLAEVRLIDEKMKKLKLEGLLTTKLEEQLAKQKELVNAAAGAASAKAPSIDQEKGQKIQGAAGEIQSAVIDKAFTKGSEVLNSSLGSSFTAGASKFAGIFGAILAIAEMIVNIIPQMIEKMAGLFKAAQELPKRVLSGVKDLGAQVRGFTENFLGDLLGALPEIFDSLIEDFLIKMVDSSAKLFEKLPQVLLSLADKIPDLIEKLVTGLVDSSILITIAIIKALPKIVGAFFTLVWRFWTGLIKGLVMGIINGLKNIGKGLKVKVDTKSVEEAAKKFTNKLTGAASKIFKVEDLASSAKDPKEAISKAAIAGANAVKKAGKNFFDGLKDVWMWIWKNILQPIIGALRAVWDVIVNLLKQVWGGIVALLQGLWDGLKAIWDGVIKLLQGLWNGLKAIWDAVITALSGVWAALKAVWDTVIRALSGVWAALKSVWDTVIGALSGIWNALKAVWDGVFTSWDSFMAAIKNLWDTVIASFSAVWESVKSAFSSIIAAFQSVFAAVGVMFTGLWEGIKNVFATIMTTLSEAWAGVVNFFGTLKETVTNAFSGVVDFFSNMKEKISEAFSGVTAIFDGLKEKLTMKMPEWLQKFIDSVEKLSGGGGSSGGGGALGKARKALGFAEGGVVPGKSDISGNSVLNDKILALLSPGEVVIPRSLLSNPAVKALVQAILSGSIKPAMFAEGGFVKPSFGGSAPGAAMVAQQAAGPTNVVINMELWVEAKEAMDETFIRNKLMPAVKSEFKRASLDGQFVMSSKGIR